MTWLLMFTRTCLYSRSPTQWNILLTCMYVCVCVCKWMDPIQGYWMPLNLKFIELFQLFPVRNFINGKQNNRKSINMLNFPIEMRKNLAQWKFKLIFKTPQSNHFRRRIVYIFLFDIKFYLDLAISIRLWKSLQWSEVGCLKLYQI